MVNKDPIVENCNGCGRIIVGPEPGPACCTVFLIPSAKWRSGSCPMATHLKKDAIEVKNVNPLKASKRKALGK